MRDFHLTDCVNCGKETMIDFDRPGDTCQFCGKDARKKEVILMQTQTMPEVPKKPENYKRVGQYYNKNKEAIITDYYSMKLREFLARWKLSTERWQKLKVEWEVEGKHRYPKKPKVEKQTQKDTGGNVDVSLTEHERYLILLGYQQASREFLKSGKTRLSSRNLRGETEE